MYNELATILKMLLIFPSLFWSRPHLGRQKKYGKTKSIFEMKRKRPEMDLNLNSS
jgi:hypothetical protein